MNIYTTYKTFPSANMLKVYSKVSWKRGSTKSQNVTTFGIDIKVLTEDLVSSTVSEWVHVCSRIIAECWHCKNSGSWICSNPFTNGSLIMLLCRLVKSESLTIWLHRKQTCRITSIIKIIPQIIESSWVTGFLWKCGFQYFKKISALTDFF